MKNKIMVNDMISLLEKAKENYGGDLQVVAYERITSVHDSISANMFGIPCMDLTLCRDSDGLYFIGMRLLKELSNEK